MLLFIDFYCIYLTVFVDNLYLPSSCKKRQNIVNDKFVESILTIYSAKSRPSKPPPYKVTANLNQNYIFNALLTSGCGPFKLQHILLNLNNFIQYEIKSGDT